MFREDTYLSWLLMVEKKRKRKQAWKMEFAAIGSASASGVSENAWHQATAARVSLVNT